LVKYGQLIKIVLTNFKKIAESFSSKIRKKTRMSTLTTFNQHCTVSPSHSDRRRKINKSIHIAKEEVKISLFANDMKRYIETLKTPPKTY